MQIHLALSEPPRWTDSRLDDVVDVHVTPGLDSISRAVNEADRNLLPEEPTIAFAVPTNGDPARAPKGRALARVQLLEVPFQPRGDAADTIDVGACYAECSKPSRPASS